MNVVVDENIPRPTVEALRANGHTVTDVRGTADQGVADSSIWETAQREGALLITTDKGFADHRLTNHFGILIIRLRQPNLEKIHSRIMLAISQRTSEDWRNLMVVMRDRVQSVFRYTREN